jgi:hypothetical protein
MRYKGPRKGLILLWALGLFAWWLRYHPPGLDLILFEDDARQHVFWTAIFQDPTLFPDDLLTTFISSKLLDPLIYQFLYRAGINWLDPLPLSQFYSLMLLLVSIWLLHELTRWLIQDPRGQYFAGTIFLFFSLYFTSGGLPRSFAFPLLLGFLLLLERRCFRWAMAVVALEALLYPPILLNCLALAGCDLVSRWFAGATGKRWLQDAALAIGILVVVGGFLVLVYGKTDQELLGQQVSLETAKGMAEFHPGGRSHFFRDNLLAYLLIGRSGIGLAHVGGFAFIVVAMGLFMGFKKIRVPTPALHLIWTSLLIFTAAHLLLFRLHLPSRYTLYTLPLALILISGATFGGFLGALQPFLKRLDERWAGVFSSRKWGWILVGALILSYGLAQIHFLYRVDPQFVILDRHDQQMLSFLGGLPKTSLIAGHPMDMNNVPLIARRKVLANHELSIPYYLGYYNRIKKRTLDMLGAYYASDWGECIEFVNRYEIDALVIRKSHFREPRPGGNIYFEPFDSTIRSDWQADRRFVLADPPNEYRCFENDRYVVLCFKSKQLAK